jgi:hypothetical protein
MINKDKLKAIIENGLSLEEFAFLYILNNEGYDSILKDMLYNVDTASLVERRLLYSNFRPTEKALLIINLVFPKEVVPLRYTENFEKFWKAYPTTSGSDFSGEVRVLRKTTDKKGTLAVFLEEIQTEEQFESLMKGLEKEKKFRVMNNSMRFMLSPKNYLTRKSYLDYIDLDDY